MVTFTINIPQMLAYIPYMDPMGMGSTLALHLGLVISPHPLSEDPWDAQNAPFFAVPWNYGNDGWRTQWIPTIFIVPICPNYTRNPSKSLILVIVAKTWYRWYRW